MIVRKTTDEIVVRWLDENGHIFTSGDDLLEESAVVTATWWAGEADDEDAHE